MIKLYSVNSLDASSCWVFANAISYCVAPTSTTSMPGCRGMMKGVSGASVAYVSVDRSMPAYPYAPPPRVQGTELQFALHSRCMLCRLAKLGLPSIRVNCLCLKKSSRMFAILV